MNVLFADPNKVDWNQMPFPKKWFDGLLADKVGEPRGYLKIRAFEHKDELGLVGPGKLIYEFGEENQITYWLKHAFAMLEGGIFFKDSGEHKGYRDGSGTTIDETTPPSGGGMPIGWRYLLSSGDYVYSTQAWKSLTDTIAIGTDIAPNTLLFPFFPTKMRFGQGGPTDITTAIDPASIALNDVNAQGAGNQALPALNFIMIERSTHIALTTTGYSTTAPSGYYADYGSVFKNITVYQVTMPPSITSYCYDGKSLNEAGLFCDASLEGTVGSTHNMPNGMMLAKRYFSPIQKTQTISINFQWSIVK